MSQGNRAAGGARPPTGPRGLTAPSFLSGTIRAAGAKTTAAATVGLHQPSAVLWVVIQPRGDVLRAPGPRVSPVCMEAGMVFNLDGLLSACPGAFTLCTCYGPNCVLSKCVCGSPNPLNPECEEGPEEASEHEILKSTPRLGEERRKSNERFLEHYSA